MASIQKHGIFKNKKNILEFKRQTNDLSKENEEKSYKI